MDTFLRALAVFSAQLVVIVSIATIAETLGRAADPRLRLAYWRGIALTCLALPFTAFFRPQDSSLGMAFVSASMKGAHSALVHTVLPASAARVVFWLLCVGALVRLGSLYAGSMSLRQLRRRSRKAILTSDLEALRAELAPHAALCLSCELAQPASFGIRRPIILLPERFFSMDPEAQRTVACHELLHVARRDWPWIVVEEVTRAVFWFHPAVWWLVDRIQESREQLVDRLVIARMPSKRAYMTALLAFADSARSVAVATAFLRRRHLRSRLQKLVKESPMSRTRLVWTVIVLCCVMASAIAGTVVALPLRSPIGEAAVLGQQVANGKDPGVTAPKVVSQVKPQYTPEAMKAQIQGSVMMNAVVSIDGTPGDIEVIKSLDTEYGLDKQAVAALGQWRFEPGKKDGKPVAVRVTVEMQFTLKK